MADNNNFNELLIHNLKQIAIHLDRLDAKVDEKADKEDVKLLTEEIKILNVKIDEKADKEDVKVLEMKLDRKSNRTNFKTLEQRFDRIISRLDQIENDIRTLTWTTGIGFACLGTLLVILDPF